MSLFTYSGSTAHSAQLRPYLAGVGAMAALTAGALVVFLSVATFVAFKGLPSGSSSGAAGAAYLGSGASAAPGAAGADLGAAHAAVIKDPVPGSHGRGAGSSGGSGDGGGSGDLSGAPTVPLPAPISPAPGASPGSSSSAGPVESTVNYLNQATSPLGVTAPPGPAGTVDNTARNTLNTAQPGLGDQASDTGSGLVNGLPQP